MKKRKNYKIYMLLIATSLLMALSCEEVIQIDLNSSNPKIVIEGAVTDQPGPYTVKISETTDYYNPGEQPSISGATVTISDSEGNEERLTEISPGLYETDSLQGIPGRTYWLSVEANGNSYSAESTMPVAIDIDSLYATQEAKRPHQDEDAYQIVCVFTDHPGTEDFCRLKVYRNDEVEMSYVMYNGRLTDGNTIQVDRIPGEFELNDVVKAELFSIDEPTYQYYSTLSDVLASDPAGNIMSTSVPANPVTNISGDALGYFGAFTVRADSIVIR
jgi:hypothetical protein